MPTCLFSLPYGKPCICFWEGRLHCGLSNSKYSATFMLFSIVILSLFIVGFFFAFIVVSLPWRWWGRGVWQHCKWWSKISTISVYRSHLNNETGKNILLIITVSPSCPVSNNYFCEEQNRLGTCTSLFFWQLNFRLASFMLCLSP